MKSPHLTERCVCAEAGRPKIRAFALHARRRGSLYISVVFVGALISVLGMSALLVGRLHQRAHSTVSDATTARLNAQVALRLGLKQIQDDADWRFGKDSDTWINRKSLNGGTYSLQVTDPSDSDLEDAAADPVVLTGIGTKGESVHRTQVTLAPLYRGYDSLQSAVHAGDDVEIYSVSGVDTFSADHTLSAGDDVKAFGSLVSTDVEAADTVQGHTYTGETSSGVAPKALPDPNEVLQFYKDNGTWIDVTSLPSQFATIIHNGDAEDGTTSWSGHASTVTSDSVTASTGANSLFVTARQGETSGVTQDVTHLLHSGRTYDLELAIYPTSAGEQFYVHLELHDNSGDDDHVVGPFTGPRNTWTVVNASITPWFDDLNSAQLVVNGASYGRFLGDSGGSTNDFRIDNVTLRETGTVRNIDRVLLSPHHNPFGATNAQGIYLIDLSHNKLVLRNSRVFGTLVLIDPHSSTVVGDESPLAMSPAVPAYPTLLIEGDELAINPSSAGLVESALGINLNPTDAPYDGVGSDADMADIFASKIEGLVYSSEDITLQGLSIEGQVISQKDVFIDDDFSMTYDNRFYRSPPPGFSGPEQIRILLGSARRISD